VTKNSNKLLLDDQQSSITISDQNGNTVTLDQSGISSGRSGKTVAVSDSNVSVNDGAFEVT
jgi:hypothetical protein